MLRREASVSPARAFQEGSPIVESGGIGGFNLQRSAVVSNGSLQVLQAIIREGPVVKGSAMARIEGHRLGVILNRFLKAPLREPNIRV